MKGFCMENNILILSINKFPNGDAGAVRQYAFSKLFKLTGWEPYIIGMGMCTNYNEEEHDSIKYISFRSDKNNFFSRLKDLVSYKKRLKFFLNKNRDFYGKILVIDIPFNALLYVKKFAKKNRKRLYHDSVEWYSPEQFTYGKLNFNYITKELYNKYWIDKNFNVIVISKYLEDHFRSRGCNTLRIPSILDVEGIICQKNTDPEKLIIVYAGSPGKKDYIKEIIEGINYLEEVCRRKIELRIIGATKDQIKEISGLTDEVLQTLQNVIVYKGRVPRAEVLKNLEEADFTVLMRSPKLRYAKAGFPTKVAESLACATPVICNITSDLGDFIRNGENGIIVEDCTAEAFSHAIKKVLSLTFEQRKKMYESSRKCAELYFDYKQYVDPIRHF